MALPLAMALSIAIGSAPQNGLYTSIVPGLIVAALGGSRTQVSGPTAAFVVILAPIYAKYGLGGLAGLLLIGMGLARLGRLIEFIPHPVATGFTAGIATVIATLQIRDALGLKLAHNPESYFARLGAMLEARHSASPREAFIAFLTLALLGLFPRISRRIPAALVVLPITTVAAALLSRWVFDFPIATIGSRFHSSLRGTVVNGRVRKT